MARFKTERQVEERLARKLRIPMVPQGIWQELRDKSFVREILDSPNSEEAFSLLEAECRSYLRAATRPVRRTPVERRHRRAGPKSLLSDGEIRRAEVFSVFLATLAGRDVAVLKFRKEVLADRVLSQPAAQSLLLSPAPYVLTATELRTWDIPAREHRVEVEHQREETSSVEWRDRVVLKLGAGNKAKTYRFVIPRSFGDGMWIEVPPALWGRATPFGKVEPFVRRSSAFDQLRKASDWLSHRFPWQRWDSVWFVLTNTPPFIPPIQPGLRSLSSRSDSIEAYRRGLLTLEIDPWLTAASLLRVYRAYQRALLGGRNRGIRRKSLDLFQFVTEREGTQGRRKTWDELRVEWNRAGRDGKYGDYRNFRRDFERARRAILLPEVRAVGGIPLW